MDLSRQKKLYDETERSVIEVNTKLKEHSLDAADEECWRTLTQRWEEIQLAVAGFRHERIEHSPFCVLEEVSLNLPHENTST